MLQVRRGADCEDRHRQGENSRIWMVIDYLRCVSGASLAADLYLHSTQQHLCGVPETSPKWEVTEMSERLEGTAELGLSSCSTFCITDEFIILCSDTNERVIQNRSTNIPQIAEDSILQTYMLLQFYTSRHSTHYSPSIYEDGITFPSIST